MLTSGTRVVCRWSGKRGTVMARDAGVADRLGSELVLLDPFVPRWREAQPVRLLRGIEVIYHRRDLKILADQTPPSTDE